LSALLEVQGLGVTFPVGRERVPVLADVSFQLHAGRCLALVGESGSGKSMTALSILRLVPRPGRIDSGSVELAGRELMRLSVPDMRSVRGREVAMIFQEPMTSLNPVVSVGEQVVEAILLHESVSRKAARERTVELFRRVGIPDAGERFHTFPHQLSGGLKQRVMIAMALAVRPRVLLADEPTTALDVTVQAQILELLRVLQAESNTAILLITHDFGVVNQLADDIAVMYAGRIVETGPRTDVLRTPSHPYTQGLLRALPSRAHRGERLQEIPGRMPSPRDLPAGCPFAPRCPEMVLACGSWTPHLTELGQRSVACLRREDLRRTESTREEGPRENGAQA
jgi:peptide/nickel transport system ATP-binding protein